MNYLALGLKIQNQQQKKQNSTKTPPKSSDLNIDVETLVAITVEKAKWTKIIRFRAGGDRRSYNIALVHKHDVESYRRTSL